MKIEGGFLPALVGLIPLPTGTALSALGVGALSGLQVQVSKTNQKRIVS